MFFYGSNPDSLLSLKFETDKITESNENPNFRARTNNISPVEVKEHARKGITFNLVFFLSSHTLK